MLGRRISGLQTLLSDGALTQRQPIASNYFWALRFRRMQVAGYLLQQNMLQPLIPYCRRIKRSLAPSVRLNARKNQAGLLV
jgi:hypothetical protein